MANVTRLERLVHDRNLAVYPECAQLQEISFRKVCCDLKRLSAAGLDFCYNDIIHEEGTFVDCVYEDDPIKSFGCCADKA